MKHSYNVDDTGSINSLWSGGDGGQKKRNAWGIYFLAQWKYTKAKART